MPTGKDATCSQAFAPLNLSNLPNTVPANIPPLNETKEFTLLLFSSVGATSIQASDSFHLKSLPESPPPYKPEGVGTTVLDLTSN